MVSKKHIRYLDKDVLFIFYRDVIKFPQKIYIMFHAWLNFDVFNRIKFRMSPA